MCVANDAVCMWEQIISHSVRFVRDRRIIRTVLGSSWLTQNTWRQDAIENARHEIDK